MKNIGSIIIIMGVVATILVFPHHPCNCRESLSGLLRPKFPESVYILFCFLKLRLIVKDHALNRNLGHSFFQEDEPMAFLFLLCDSCVKVFSHIFLNSIVEASRMRRKQTRRTAPMKTVLGGERTEVNMRPGVKAVPRVERR